MSLPKRDGVQGRYYLIQKPDTNPEVLEHADQCIQDVLDGTAKENHSGYPVVVRNQSGTPFLPSQLLGRYLSKLPLKGFPYEEAVVFCDALRRLVGWKEIDYTLEQYIKKQVQERYFEAGEKEDDFTPFPPCTVWPELRPEDVDENLLRFTCYVAVCYTVYGASYNTITTEHYLDLVSQLRPDMVKQLKTNGSGKLPKDIQRRKTEHFTASANDVFAAIRITARDSTEECYAEILDYSNVPPMMAAIKSGDIEAIRSLLHAGHSPNEPQCYQVMIGDWPRDDEASPLELAVLENRMDMVQLLIECGADLTHNPEELLCGSLRSQDLTLFSFLVDVGVRIPATQRDICRLFLHLVDRDEPNVLPILKRMGMDLKQYGGEALRSMASHGNQLLVEYLIQNGADINYHKPDMVFPYASTPVTEAARHNDFSMVRWLVEQGADITIPDKYGDRPYTVAVQNKNQEMAAYLKALEPEEWHNEQEKARQLTPYKLPAKLVEYLKTGPLRLEFPERELVKWAELYPYMDVQEMTWKRKKLLSLMAKMDNYSDYLLLWSPRDKKLWYLDIEHKEFHPLTKWEEFIADPGKYLNGMIEGEFEE